MTLHSLTYMSSAVHPPSRAEINHLLTRARIRNAQENVTGVLLHSDGSFLQCIEGPTEGIQRVFAAITADPLHHNVLMLLYDEIKQRAFPNGRMAYRDASKTVVDIDEALTQALSAHVGSLSAVHHLLGAFWNGGLGNRYQAVANAQITIRRPDQDALDAWKTADFAATDAEALVRVGVNRFAQGISGAPKTEDVQRSYQLRTVSNACLVAAIDAIKSRNETVSGN